LIGASCFAKSRTFFLFRLVSILKKTLINSRPSGIAAVPVRPSREARSLTTLGGRPLRLPFMFAPTQGDEPLLALEIIARLSVV
jgi:hypothetical protein